MECKNHLGIAAVNRCTGCAEPYCENCLVEMMGQPYCGSCKTMAVSGTSVIEAATVQCKESKEALVFAIVGVFFLTIIFEPIALFKALKAKRVMAANPRLSGSGEILAVYIMSIIAILLWVLDRVVSLKRM